ncbi:MAG: ribosome assembly factor SBDS [Aigarchaeota archaeon]|nr:ribosome assembly factor SBDS [Aigarchaeota archaeon]
MHKEGFSIARLTKGGENYEILVDPDNALKLKLGENISVRKVLLYDTIFRDSKKGTRASEEQLRKNFKTTDPLEIASIILKQGEIQVTSEQRRKLIEDKRRQIVDFISKNSIDPRTNAPHPPTRIENALEEIDVSIDPFIDAKEQAKSIIERLRSVLPLKIGVTRLSIRMPANFVGKAYGLIKSYGNLTREEWQKDGSWICVAEASTGAHLELMDKLNRLCAGRVEIKLIE